jgi:hypothetical protein
MIETTSDYKLATTDLSQAAFSLTEGRNAKSTLLATQALNGCASIKLAGDGRSSRGCSIKPVGRGADGATFDYKLWLKSRTTASGSPDSNDSGFYGLDLLGNGTMTLSASTGVAGDVFGTSDRLVDTITLTKSALLEHIETAFGIELKEFSPGGDKQARIDIPEAFNASELVFEVDLVTATGANALISQYT